VGFEHGSGESPEAVKVRLFSREYSILGHGNRKYVENLARFINDKAEEIRIKAKVVSTLDLVILTMLNITDELFQSNQIKDRTIRELEEKTERLIKAIDRAV